MNSQSDKYYYILYLDILCQTRSHDENTYIPRANELNLFLFHAFHVLVNANVIVNVKMLIKL